MSAIGLENCSRAFLTHPSWDSASVPHFSGSPPRLTPADPSTSAPNLITEKFACRSDDLFSRNFNLAVLVQVKCACRSLIHNRRSKCLRFFDCLHLVDDVNDLLRCSKIPPMFANRKFDIKPRSTTSLAWIWRGIVRTFFCIKLYHRAFLIFSVNREEVQKAL